MSKNNSLTNQEYLEIQTQVGLCGSILSGLDIGSAIQSANYAESVGPIFDPTLYIKASKRLAAVKAMFQAAQELQHAYRELMDIVMTDGKTEYISALDRKAP